MSRIYIKKKLFLIFIYLIISKSLYSIANINNLNTKLHVTNESQIEQKKRLYITIFVHGIISIKPYLSIGLIPKLLCDNIEGTLYHDAVYHTRRNPFFWRNQLMQNIGLHRILSSDDNTLTSSQALAQLYLISTNTVRPHEENIFYTFGWSGLLSHHAREKAALQFFIELTKEIKKLQAQGINPKIRLIGYSHGANVCLNLAKAKEQFKKITFSIEELILIGCPIQDINSYLVNDPFFINVYNFSSHKDRIQQLDWFSSPKTIFSQKRFSHKKNYSISPKVTQATLQIKRFKNHKNYSLKKIFAYTDQHLSARSSHYLTDESPGHIELWFLGSLTPHRNYRIKFILYPYPIVVFIPFIIKAIQDSNFGNNSADYSLKIDFRPEKNQLIVKTNRRQYTALIPYKKITTLFNETIEKIQQTSYTHQFLKKYIKLNKETVIHMREKKGIMSKHNLRLRKKSIPIKNSSNL